MADPRPPTGKELLDFIAGIRARQVLKRSLVHVEGLDSEGRRIMRPHALVGSRLVPLTPQQIADLEDA